MQEAIPFELSHRTGFTCDLMEEIHSQLVLAGMYYMNNMIMTVVYMQALIRAVCLPTYIHLL